MSVDFDTWYEYFGDDNAERHFHEVRWNYPKEEQLPKEKLAEFCSIFDGFFLSPCDFIEGVPEKREFITKARAYKTLDEAKKAILSRKKLFEKIMLYRFFIKEDNVYPFWVSIAEYPDLSVIQARRLEREGQEK